jgi:hypothetical protein
MASTPNISNAILPKIGGGSPTRTMEARSLVIEIPRRQRTIVNGYAWVGEEDGRLPRNGKYDLVAWVGQGHYNSDEGHVTAGSQDDII